MTDFLAHPLAALLAEVDADAPALVRADVVARLELVRAALDAGPNPDTRKRALADINAAADLLGHAPDLRAKVRALAGPVSWALAVRTERVEIMSEAYAATFRDGHPGRVGAVESDGYDFSGGVRGKYAERYRAAKPNIRIAATGAEGAIGAMRRFGEAVAAAGRAIGQAVTIAGSPAGTDWWREACEKFKPARTGRVEMNPDLDLSVGGEFMVGDRRYRVTAVHGSGAYDVEEAAWPAPAQFAQAAGAPEFAIEAEAAEAPVHNHAAQPLDPHADDARMGASGVRWWEGKGKRSTDHNGRRMIVYGNGENVLSHALFDDMAMEGPPRGDRRPIPLSDFERAWAAAEDAEPRAKRSRRGVRRLVRWSDGRWFEHEPDWACAHGRGFDGPGEVMRIADFEAAWAAAEGDA